MQQITARIGLVDDDPKLTGLVKRYLENNGFPEVSILSASSLAEAEQIPVDLLVLDIMMPEMDGFELLKRLRKTSDIPVLFLSARNEVFDRVVGLELGADDYLTKPFEPRELLARIQAILRRRKRESPASEDQGSREKQVHGDTAKKVQVKRLGILDFEEFRFDLDRQIVQVGTAENQLTTFEFQLLRLFCDNPQIILSRQQIMDWMERHEFGSYDRSVDVGISRLRKRIERCPEKPEVLKTVWGRGYQLLVRKKAPQA